jgi:reactive intermediate/imine deaminase
MPGKQPLQTDAAPAAIGPYSQAIRHGDTVFVSGQIPLVPETGALVDGDITAQTRQVFRNIAAIAGAAGVTLDHAVKINISLVDLRDFAAVNAVMTECFQPPYPARACVGVAALPKGAALEVEAILAL